MRFLNPSYWTTGHLWAWVVLCTAQALPIHIAHAADTTPAQQLSHWTAQAGTPAKAEQGEALFNKRHGGEWSCASCHGSPPTTQGKHASTGKSIAPLAPAFNAKALSDTAKTDKWFKRNCKDVLSRECSAQEKADVLAYLTSLKP
jgi:cytochrome c peroxidase